MSAEITARQPVDYVCVDTQHGVNDYASGLDDPGDRARRGKPIARVPWNEPGIIGKLLDAGAHGVIVPMVNTREQAEAVVRSRATRPTARGAGGR